MNARRAKQIVYGAFYLVVFFAILAGVWARFAPRVPAAPPLVVPPSTDIIVGDFITFASGGNNYTFLARVENHNTGFAAQNFGYVLNLYNASGTLLASIPGSSYLYGGEVKYIVLPNIPASSAFDHASFAIKNPVWVPAATMGLVPQFGNPLPVTGSATNGDTMTVTGALTDYDTASFTNIEVVAIFYAADGVAIGASETELNGIGPNQTEAFSISYPAVPSANLLTTKLYAYALRT